MPASKSLPLQTCVGSRVVTYVACSTNVTIFFAAEACSPAPTSWAGREPCDLPAWAPDATGRRAGVVGVLGERACSAVPHVCAWPRASCAENRAVDPIATDEWACLSSASQWRACPPREGLRLVRGEREEEPSPLVRIGCAQAFRLCCHERKLRSTVSTSPMAKWG